jgi:hypothetical protein
MAAFDPERFEAEKYDTYFADLQEAYRMAFDRMRERYDSTLVHAIDQQVLNESEPVFENGEFDIRLPEDPHDRLTGVVVERETAETVLGRYTEELCRALREVFGVEEAGDTTGG